MLLIVLLASSDRFVEVLLREIVFGPFPLAARWWYRRAYGLALYSEGLGHGNKNVKGKSPPWASYEYGYHTMDPGSPQKLYGWLSIHYQYPPPALVGPQNI